MIRAIHKPLKVQAVRLTKEIASVPDSSPFRVFGVKDRAKDSNEPGFWRLPENQTLPGRFYIRQHGETQVVNIGDWLVKYEGSTTVEVLTSGEFHRRFRQIRDADEPVELTMETHPWPRSLNNAFDIIARADETLSSAIHAQIREQQRVEARKLEDKILGTIKDFIESEKLSATGALIRERKAENMVRKYLKGRQSDENRDPSSDINAGKTDPRCSGPCVHGGSQCSGNGSCGHHD